VQNSVLQWSHFLLSSPEQSFLLPHQKVTEPVGAGFADWTVAEGRTAVPAKVTRGLAEMLTVDGCLAAAGGRRQRGIASSAAAAVTTASPVFEARPAIRLGSSGT